MAALPFTPTDAGFNNPQFPNPHGPHDAKIIIYGYTPSLPFCILALVLFSLNTIIHTLQLIHYRFYFFTPLTLASLLETLGYIFRALSSQTDPYNTTYFIPQYFLIVVAPVFVSASIYVCLSRLVASAAASVVVVGYDARARRGGRCWWWVLRPRWILWGFVSADVATTVMQIAGAAVVGCAESGVHDPRRGVDVLLAGLALQAVSFTVFLGLLVMFRMSLEKVDQQGVDAVVVKEKDQFVQAVLVASLLVYVRTIFRLAETAQGLFGYVETHEVFFGTLEFAPVVLAVWILAVWHPGRWVPPGEVSVEAPLRVEESASSSSLSKGEV